MGLSSRCCLPMLQATVRLPLLIEDIIYTEYIHLYAHVIHILYVSEYIHLYVYAKSPGKKCTWKEISKQIRQQRSSGRLLQSYLGSTAIYCLVMEILWFDTLTMEKLFFLLKMF